MPQKAAVEEVRFQNIPARNAVDIGKINREKIKTR
jgi:hypothetical protein